MKNLYDKDYFERGIETGKSCYTNYRWIPELTIPMVARIIEYCGIGEEDKILDYGCAKGYCVKAFRLLHRQAYGFDISEYAKSSVPRDIEEYILPELEGNYNWIISKDVFEHVPYEEIDELLNKLQKMTDNLFAVIPLGAEKRYVIPSYELDSTHIIRENLQWWEEKFQKAGFEVVEASYNVKYIKESWEHYEKGNGFFKVKRKT